MRGCDDGETAAGATDRRPLRGRHDGVRAHRAHGLRVGRGEQRRDRMGVAGSVPAARDGGGRDRRRARPATGTAGVGTRRRRGRRMDPGTAVPARRPGRRAGRRIRSHHPRDAGQSHGRAGRLRCAGPDGARATDRRPHRAGADRRRGGRAAGRGARRPATASLPGPDADRRCGRRDLQQVSRLGRPEARRVRADEPDRDSGHRSRTPADPVRGASRAAVPDTRSGVGGRAGTTGRGARVGVRHGPGRGQRGLQRDVLAHPLPRPARRRVRARRGPGRRRARADVSGGPPLPGLVGIDHILTRGATATALERIELPGSDHHGLVAGIRLPPPSGDESPVEGG